MACFVQYFIYMKIIIFILLFSTALNGQILMEESFLLDPNTPKSLLNLKMFQQNYISGAGDLDTAYNNLEIGIRRYSPSGLNIKGELLYSFAESDEPYIDIQDFNISFGSKWFISNSYLGRRTLDWSEMDKFWGLGAWEPYATQNPLDPKRQG